MAPMALPVTNSRDVITPEAFRVADHLIGLPLAQPKRRLGAILIDLLLVGILVALLDAVGFLLALVGAFFVFRLSRAKTAGRWYSRFYRRGLGCFGAMLTFIVLMVAFDAVTGLFEEDEEGAPESTVDVDSAGNIDIEGVGWTSSALIIRDAVNLGNATRAGERDTLADALVGRALEEGVLPGQLRQVVAGLGGDSVFSPAAIVALEAAVETASARAGNRPPRSADEIRIADSIAAAEVAAASTLAASLRDSLAHAQPELVALQDTLRTLRAQVDELSELLGEERVQRQQAEQRLDQGAVGWVMSSISDELGLGLGWLGLYFTAFTVLGGGVTPGKRVFRLRVIRLDGRPIGWWTSLQRFGGYSASVFTGLLGFAEMLWDDNRQALQDKLVHTVVIQDPKKPRAGALDGAAPAPAPSAAPAGAADAAAAPPDAHAASHAPAAETNDPAPTPPEPQPAADAPEKTDEPPP